MTEIKRVLSLMLVLALSMAGAAFAQVDEGVNTVGDEEFLTIGGIDVSDPEPFDAGVDDAGADVDTGAIIFTAETPGDQHPNIDLVGPDDYAEHLEIADEDEQVVEDLLPGVYSVAATDDELQLAHSLVEVMPGQATRVHVDLTEGLAGFDTENMLAEDRFVYPDNAFEVGEPFAFEDNEFGAVAVETDNESANFVVTGPNAYSERFEGAFTAENLQPGLYVVAGTDDDSQIATSTFRVDAATATTLVPVFDSVAETEAVDGDVAGGGEAEDGQPVDAEEPANAGPEGEDQVDDPASEQNDAEIDVFDQIDEPANDAPEDTQQ